MREKKNNSKTLLRPEVIVQFEDREANLDQIVEKIMNLYVTEGHYKSSIKSLQVYVKPEEDAAYYVINQKTTGKIDLF